MNGAIPQSGNTLSLIRSVVEKAEDAEKAKDALGQRIEKYRSRLRGMVAKRLDSRMRGRVDVSDVIQEGCIDVIRRLPDYAECARTKGTSFFTWVAGIVLQRVTEAWRRHRAQMRDAWREVSIDRSPTPEASTVAPAVQPMHRGTSPSEAAIRNEEIAGVHEALDALDALRPMDSEILKLEFYEQMSHAEVASALGIEHEAAKKRFLRALRRFGEDYTASHGGNPGDRS